MPARSIYQLALIQALRVKPAYGFKAQQVCMQYSMLPRLLLNFTLGWFSSTDYKKVFLGCQCRASDSGVVTHKSSIESLSELQACYMVDTDHKCSLVATKRYILLLCTDRLHLCFLVFSRSAWASKRLSLALQMLLSWVNTWSTPTIFSQSKSILLPNTGYTIQCRSIYRKSENFCSRWWL